MKILFITPALTIGGIEVLALRFSEAFGAAGHEVGLYDFSPEHRNKELVARFGTSDFRLVDPKFSAWKEQAFWKLNGILFKTRIHRKFRRRVAEWHFARFIHANKFDIVCSLSFHEDYLACKYCRLAGIPVVLSMHGTYEYAAPQWPEMARAIYENVNAIIYAADKNMSWYRQQSYFRPEMPIHKIYSGTDLSTPVPQTISRADLGLPSQYFIYILVARGIVEKGWEQTIDAFLSLQAVHSETALLLVGDSEYVQALKAKYDAKSNIIFYGSHPNSVELTRLADVGLLPTYFPIETLPNVIIDYLRCDLPVISTDIGEIKEMLRTEDGLSAGIVLPLEPEGQGVSVATLREAMEIYLNDPEQYRATVLVVRKAVQKFDIRDCVHNYIQVFNQVVGK